jgi:hypothetical protein
MGLSTICGAYAKDGTNVGSNHLFPSPAKANMPDEAKCGCVA